MFKSALITGVLMAAFAATVFAQDLSGGKVPASWPKQGNWQVVADPETPGKQVLFVDAIETGMPELTVSEGKEDYVLSFRARYDHPYKGLSDGGGDGQHAPHWKLSVGPDLWLVDSYIWSGLLLQDGAKDVKRIDGTRPRKQWKEYTLARKGTKLQVFLDGRQAMDVELPRGGSAPLKFGLMNEKLWLSDIKVEPWHEVAEKMVDHSGDNWQVNASFQSGDLPQGWNLDGTWSIVEDPEKPGHKVLTSSAEGRVNSFITAYNNFKDFDVEMRVRFDTQYKSFPNNDNLHHPLWRLILKQNTKTNTTLNWADEFIWSSCFFQFKGNLVGGDRKIVRGKWQTVKITCFRNEYTLYVDGEQVIKQDIPDVPPGAIGVQVMDASLWVDSITIQPHSKPTAYAPEYRIQPSSPGAIYARGDKPALNVRLINDDKAAHTVKLTGTVTPQPLGHESKPSTDPVLRLNQTYVMEAGQTLSKSLELALEQIGLYDTSLRMEVDGRPFADYRTTVTIAPKQPQWSQAYSSKFGLCTSDSADAAHVAELMGVHWARGGWVFQGLNKQADGSWSFAAADAAVAQGRQFSRLGKVNLWMNSGRGHLLEGIDEAAGTFGAAAKHFAGQGMEYEIWNEPNHGAFWRLSPIDPWDFFAVQAESYNAIKAGDPDAVVNTYSVSGVDSKFVRTGFEAGGWKYLDVLGYHPYGYPARPEQIMPKAAADIKSVVDAFGGWIEHHITEHGYPTCTTSMGVDEVTQADFHTRMQLLMNAIDWGRGLHIYTTGDGRDPGECSDPEARFGVVRMDLTAKPAFFALATMSAELANSIFVGQFDAAGKSRPVLASGADEGAYLQVYRKFDGSTVVAAWAIKPTTATLHVEGAGAEVVSSFGTTDKLNAVDGKITLHLGSTPQYVRLSAPQPRLLAMAADALRQDLGTLVRDRLAKLPDPAMGTALQSRFDKADQAAAQVLKNPGAGKSASLTELRAITADALSAGASNFSGTSAADALYHYELAVCRGLVLRDATDPQVEMAKASEMIAQHRPGHASLIFAERMLREARLQSQRADSLAKEGVAPDLQAHFRTMASELAHMAMASAQCEPVVYRNTLFNVVPKHFVLGAGTQSSMKLVIRNGEQKSLDLATEIDWPADWGTPADHKSFSVAPDTRQVVSQAISIPAGIPQGTYSIPVRFVRDGKVVQAVPVSVRITAPLDASIEPLDKPLSEQSKLTVVLRNTTSVTFNGTVELLDPAGKQLSCADPKVSITAGGTRNLVFVVAHPEAKPLNEYPFTIRIKDGTDAVVVSQTWALDMAVTSLVEQPPALDGSLTHWTAAYPVHARVVEGEKTSATFAATAWSLIDARHFYLMVKVHDELHSQEHTGGNLWKGDSIQLSVDPKHQRTEGMYGFDDVELGFAVATNRQTQLDTCYVSPQHAILGTTRFLVKRDDATKTTLYQVAIPLDQFNGLKATEGYQFGWNIAVHDAGKTGSRERYLEVTGGTSMKNPHNYLTFTVRK